ncbi:MAG: CBS domain-containing protein [Chloroflexi bacterium]|nr:CBS domain-containing protein [Chloroflexota bacterium]
MKPIKQLLQTKGNAVWTITPDASVFDAIKLMSDKSVGALPVVDGEKLVGIISERDYARKVILQGRSSRDTPVREIMTTKVYYLRAEQSIEDGMALMTDKRIRHLPVFESERMVGIVSIGDLVREIISQQEFLIGQLENYITGG